MTRNEDGTYSQVGFIKDKYGNDITEYIYDKDGNIAFERGFTREVEGSLPLQINGIGKDLKEYSITGNTVQDGTPTPENPVEVLGCGERTANLFNKNDATTNGYINRSGYIQTTADTNWKTTANYIPCTYNTICISTKYGLGAAAAINCYDSEKTLIATFPQSGNNESFKVLSLPEGTAFIKTCCRENSLDDYMINEGSEQLPYEPYGYKIPVVTRGKNLLKLKDVDSVIRGVTVSVKNNSITVKGTATSNGGRTDYLSETFILQPGTYFISGDIVNSMVYCLTDRSNATAVVAFASSTSFTLTEKTKVAFGLNFISGVSYDATVNVMFNEGDKKFPYEPYHEPITTPIYLPTPLYRGEVLRSDGSREMKWEKLVLTGEETWKLQSVNDYGIYNFYIEFPINVISGLCNNFKRQNSFISDTKDVGFLLSKQATSTTLYIRADNTIATDVNTFKSWLAAQYAAGTPVTVWYKLAAPTTETFTAPQIPTLNGTTVIDVDTVVKPTEMHVKCKSSK